MINTIFLDSGWFNGDAPLNDDLRNDYVYLLQDNGINQQFCDVGLIQDNGTLLAQSTAKLKEWIRMTRLVDPNQKIILALNYGHRKINPIFGTTKFNVNLSSAIARLISNYDVDGIHLDIEGFLVADTKLINLLNLVKKKINGKHLSISTPASVWTDAYIQKVATIVTQMNPMIYDTMGWGSSVVDEETYEFYFQHIIERYAELVIDCELVPTLPVYELKVADDDTIYHDPKVESLASAIKAIDNSSVQVDGAGIFWGSHFLGLYPKVYPNYVQDQSIWKTNWLKVAE
jgi:hypothetical protein